MTQRNVLWKSDELCEKSNLRKYTGWINHEYGKDFAKYEELRQWSIKNISDFWESILRYFNVKTEGSYSKVLNTEEMPGNKWFEGLKLNYAENNLNLADQEEIALFFNESGRKRKISRKEFTEQSGAIQRFLTDSGVVAGDRVASFLPNVPEAMEALYATSALGAVWSSSSPDFGSEAILDRFKQISPKVVLAPDS